MHDPSFLILKLNSRTEIFLAEIHLICQKLIGFIHLLDSLPNFKLKRIAPLWHHVTPCTHVTGKNIIFCQQTNNFAFDWAANISFLKREMFCSKSLKPATFVFFSSFFFSKTCLPFQRVVHLRFCFNVYNTFWPIDSWTLAFTRFFETVLQSLSFASAPPSLQPAVKYGEVQPSVWPVINT